MTETKRHISSDSSGDSSSVNPEGLQVIEIAVGLPAQDELHLRLEVKNQEIFRSSLTGVGCRELLGLMQIWRPKLVGPLPTLPVPEGVSHAEMLMRELVLRARGEWDFPYKEAELCHCRVVPTVKVDTAIMNGCHSFDAVKLATSAGTSCGSCRVDIEAILACRLKLARESVPD